MFDESSQSRLLLLSLAPFRPIWVLYERSPLPPLGAPFPHQGPCPISPHRQLRIGKLTGGIFTYSAVPSEPRPLRIHRLCSYMYNRCRRLQGSRSLGLSFYWVATMRMMFSAQPSRPAPMSTVSAVSGFSGAKVRKAQLAPWSRFTRRRRQEATVSNSTISPLWCPTRATPEEPGKFKNRRCCFTHFTKWPPS